MIFISTINLIIGGVDVSEFVERGNYSILKIWKTEETFTTYAGKEIISRSGWNYRLKTSLSWIPDDLMRELTAALDNDRISVTFTDPHSSDENGCTADFFTRGDNTGGTIATEYDGQLRWDINISLMSEFHVYGGII